MQTVKQLKEKAEALVARQKELLTLCATENRDPTEAEAKEIDDAAASVEKIFGDITRLQKIEDAAARVAAVTIPAPAKAKDATGIVDKITDSAPVLGHKLFAETKKELTGFELVGLAAWATAKHKESPSKSCEQHLDAIGLTQLADGFRRQKALNAQDKSWTTGSGGDNAIFTPLSTDFIDFLYNASAFISSQPMIVDMPYGSIKIPGGNASAAGTYATEVADAGYTEATSRSVTMTAKHLKAITAMSNYLLEVSPLNVAAILGQNLAQAMTIGIDSAGLRGTGSGANPSGIATLVNSGQLKHAATWLGTSYTDATKPTIAELDGTIRPLMSAIRSTNIPMLRPRWIMSNRVFTYLQFMRNTYNLPIFPGLQNTDAPTWYDGIPVTRTEQVPNNLSDGTNSDCTEIYLVYFGHVMFGITRQLRLQASTEATYVNSTNLSAFSRDETVIRGIASHNFGMRYDKAAAMIDQCRFGA